MIALNEKDAKTYAKIRDGRKCTLCGEKNLSIHAHHIFPKNLYPELKCDTNNIISLCSNCHEIYHSIFGKKYECNPITFIAFAEWEIDDKRTKDMIENLYEHICELYGESFIYSTYIEMFECIMNETKIKHISKLMECKEEFVIEMANQIKSGNIINIFNTFLRGEKNAK